MLIKVPVWFNLVLLVYPSYGPWKSLKSLSIWFSQMGKNPVMVYCQRRYNSFLTYVIYSMNWLKYIAVLWLVAACSARAAFNKSCARRDKADGSIGRVAAQIFLFITNLVSDCRSFCRWSHTVFLFLAPLVIKQEQQHIAVRPRNSHFYSIRQVLWPQRSMCGHVAHAAMFLRCSCYCLCWCCSGWLHFLDESAAEPFGLVQTLIWTLHFDLSPDRRLAQAQRNCY